MNKKLVLFIIALIFLFIIFLFFYLKESSYSLEYKVDKYTVNESYDSDNKYYNFRIQIDNNFFSFDIESKSINERKIISKINLSNTDNQVCLNIEGDLNFYDICKEGNYYYFPIKDNKEQLKEEYETFKIYNLYEKSFLLWNYNEFIYLNGEDKKNIEVFENDVYNPSLFQIVDNYLFIPNYDTEYYFKEYYLINFEDGKIEKEEFNSEINFDISYIGYDNNILSIYDKKNEKVFDLNIKNSDIKIKHGITYTENDLEKMQIENDVKRFYLIDNNIHYAYQDTKMIIPNIVVDSIIYQNETELIYLVDDSLYLYSIYTGNNLLITKEEWQFNSNNLIYVY